jgi:hypothetical protein
MVIQLIKKAVSPKYRKSLKKAKRDAIADFSERTALLLGRLACNAAPSGPIDDLSQVEFRVFSQWGEDGIIDWLVTHLPLPNHRFIEFGVESFREANCRYLMQNRNWRGFTMDCSESYVASLRGEPLFWMFDLTCKSAFVTAENINSLIKEAGFDGDLGILSIDIDGNDYWVWKAIDCVNPAIVICEYNPILGDRYAITVPYDPEFQRLKAHYSGLYFGSSILALEKLADEKGYTLLGTNSNGINAFFVRNDIAPIALSLIKRVKTFPSRHRDSRNPDGQLTFTGGLNRFDLISDMKVLNLSSNFVAPLKTLSAPYSEAWQAEML